MGAGIEDSLTLRAIAGEDVRLLDSGVRVARFLSVSSRSTRVDSKRAAACYPSATSRTIMSVNPSAKATTPTLLCRPAWVSGMSSSTTTYIMTPAANPGKAFCTSSPIARFKKNTNDEPRTVPNKGTVKAMIMARFDSFMAFLPAAVHRVAPRSLSLNRFGRAIDSFCSCGHARPVPCSV